jgi:hypothetical protein
LGCSFPIQLCLLFLRKTLVNCFLKIWHATVQKTVCFLFSNENLLALFQKNNFSYLHKQFACYFKKTFCLLFLTNILPAFCREYFTCYFPEDVPGCYQKQLFPHIRILLHIFKPFSLYSLPCILYKHVEVENKLRNIRRFQ